MPKTGIVVADGARARFLTLQPADELTPERGPRLIEHLDLSNPEGDLPERELFSDRGGRMHGSPSSSAHGSDDHRAQHRVEYERRFARRLLDEARRFGREQGLNQLVLAAEPTLLGLLRPELEKQPLPGISVVELAENLVRHSLVDVSNILTRQGLMPKSRSPAGGTYRPRGQPPALR
jgi:protein required for attachment to host cells